MISRNQSHDYGMKIIYAALVYIKNGAEFDFETLVSDITETAYVDTPLYLRKILLKTLSNYDEIITALTPFLKAWRFERLNEVAQAILIYSYAHYYYVGGVKKPIVINIAVKLAKQYIPNEDYKFINAVLDEALL